MGEHTVPIACPLAIGQPESFNYAIWQMAPYPPNKV